MNIFLSSGEQTNGDICLKCLRSIFFLLNPCHIINFGNSLDRPFFFFFRERAEIWLQREFNKRILSSTGEANSVEDRHDFQLIVNKSWNDERKEEIEGGCLGRGAPVIVASHTHPFGFRHEPGKLGMQSPDRTLERASSFVREDRYIDIPGSEFARRI